MWDNIPTEENDTAGEVLNELYADENQVDAAVAAELENQESIMESANNRLEQGRLYQLLMKHTLFEEGEADSKVLHKVQSEFRAFAKERLEIMLGMRMERPKHTSVKVQLPFNEVEIQALKDLAFKMTKGASAEVESGSEVEGQLVHQDAQKIPVQRPVAKPRTISSRPAAPTPIPAPQKMIAKKPKSEILISQTSPIKLTDAQIAEKNKNIVGVQRGVPGDTPPLPMPDPNTAMMIATMQADRNSQSGNGGMGDLGMQTAIANANPLTKILTNALANSKT